MKKFMFVLMLIISVSLCCVSCNQPIQKVDDSIKTDTSSVLFSFNNVDSINYSQIDEDICIVHCCDYDIINCSNLINTTKREKWFENEYVGIYIKGSIIQDFLSDYFNYNNTKNPLIKHNLDNKYIIVEHDVLYKDNTNDIVFYIELNADDSSYGGRIAN